MIVTFCGHREVAETQEVSEWLLKVTEQLIMEGAEEFLLGGKGHFDFMAAEAVRALKKKYPHIRSTLVLAYLNHQPVAWEKELYDGTMYPPLEGVPHRFAIARRNAYMVAEADVLVAYVQYGFGGAAKTLQLARQKKKRVLLYPETV